MPEVVAIAYKRGRATRWSQKDRLQVRFLEWVYREGQLGGVPGRNSKKKQRFADRRVSPQTEFNLHELQRDVVARELP